MSSLRVLLADDHALVRSGLGSLLEQVDGIEVVGEVGNGRLAVEGVQELKPDIVIMDITMPELNGLDATVRIKRDRPETRVIILSMHTGEEYITAALEAGADAFLVKDAAPVELELAIRAVASGNSYLSPIVAKRVLDRRALGIPATPDVALTPRQREILQLVAEGNSSKAIARKLHLSTKTVETHRSQLMERLGIRDLASLVRYAVRVGLVGSE
ncbi:MAG: response regulator transcription factor [Gemmatimonadota bacterium]